MNSDTVKPMPAQDGDARDVAQAEAVGESPDPESQRERRRTEDAHELAHDESHDDPDGHAARERVVDRVGGEDHARVREREDRARSRSSTTGGAVTRAARAPGHPVADAPASASPSATPASVGSMPASCRHTHSSTPGTTYASGWSMRRRDIATTASTTTDRADQPERLDSARVEERDHDDGADVVDDRQASGGTASGCSAHARPSRASTPTANAMSVAMGMAQPSRPLTARR